MTERSQLWPAARVTFIAAMLLFVTTIVIGILNGIDVYEPDHDTLISHVHAGTLGWITLGVSGIALLMFSDDRFLTPEEVGRGKSLAWAVTGAITLYVAAFYVGDHIGGDRIHRPIVGTLLLLVVIWFLVWLTQRNSAINRASTARLGLMLAWVSLLIGAVFGIVLGIFASQGEVPGLSDSTANAVADAHPPAMVIGFLILAAMAVIEWLLAGDEQSRSGSLQMWLLFAAGILVNIGFVSGFEEELLGPANLLMIAGVVMLVWRHRDAMVPAGWRGAGPGTFPRMSVLFLVVYLVLGTILIVRVVSGAMDFDALTEAEEGLVLSFDHVMFIGVMTSLMFGVLASRLHPHGLTMADRIMLWGVNIGIVGFAVGLITVESAIKQTFTPIMGISLLIGIAAYVTELNRSGDRVGAGF